MVCLLSLRPLPRRRWQVSISGPGGRRQRLHGSPITAYERVKHRVVGSLENNDLIMNNTFFIGVYPGLTDPMLDHMISVLDRTLA